MIFQCTEEFHHTYHKLIKNQSYKNLPEIFAKLLSEFTPETPQLGVNLNRNHKTPLVKHYKGSGGYRIYYLFIVADERVMFAHIHPKKGSMGYETITPKYLKQLVEQIASSFKNESYYILSLTEDKSEVKFIKHSINAPEN